MASYDNKLVNGKALQAAKNAIDGKANLSHTHSAATASVNGMMAAADKSKLDGMEVATLAEVKTALGIT